MLVMARTVVLTIALGCGAAAVALAEPPSAPGAGAAPSPATTPADDRLPPRTPPEDIPSLTAAQRERLASLRRQTRQQLAPQREQLRAKRLELRTMWLAEPPSEPAILKKLGEIDALRASMRPTLVKCRLAYLRLLTREQRLALSKPKRPHHCPHGARHMRGRPDHEMALPHTEQIMPWLDVGDDVGRDDDGMFEPDPMECAPHEPGAPADTRKERR